MSRKSQRSLSPGEDSRQGVASQDTLPGGKERLQQPRKANGRFIKIKKNRLVKPIGMSNIASSEGLQNDVATTNNADYPEAMTVPKDDATDETDIPAQIHNSPPALDNQTAISSAPLPPVPTPTTISAPLHTPSSATEARATQNHRTATIVAWLQYTRTYDQKERIVHPFNLPPPERIRPVAMYQRHHVRDSGLVDGLPAGAFGRRGGGVVQEDGRAEGGGEGGEYVNLTVE